MERTTIKYTIDDEELPLVSRYKYLGCMLDEFLELKDMIEDRVGSGKKALGAWWQQCNVELGGVDIGTFRILMSSLVDSTMLYG